MTRNYCIFDAVDCLRMAALYFSTAASSSAVEWRFQIHRQSPFDFICASFASHIWYGIVRHVRYAHHSARMAIAYVFQSFMAGIIPHHGTAFQLGLTGSLHAEE